MNKIQKYFLVAFLVLVAYWIVITILKPISPYPYYTFSLLMGVFPFISGILAISYSKVWNKDSGLTEKGVFFLGLGLLSWGCGELVWSYYNFFLNVSAPYPSIADFGFAPSVFFYCIGVIYIAKAAGAKLGLSRPFAQFFIIIAPVVMFLVSYFLLIIFAKQGNLFTVGDPVFKSFLDILYPIGDFLSLTIAIVISGLSFKSLLTEYKIAILPLLAGLASMFISDAIFSYTTSHNTYYNGNFGDFLFTFSLFLLTFGVMSFAQRKSV